MQMVDGKQKQLIHIAKQQLGLDEEHYRAIIAGRTKGKKTSSADLTYFEADAVINFLVSLGFKIQSNYIRTAGAARRQYWQYANARRAARTPKTGQLPNNLFVLPSSDQIKMINALAGQIAWREKGGFHLWMKKYYKIDIVKTDAEASAVIEGLKGMLANTKERGIK